MARDGFREGNALEQGKSSYDSTAVGDEYQEHENEKPASGMESRTHSAGRKRSTVEDDPFGDESNADVKYKTMAWWQAGMIMIAETVSLGILSLPSALATVGFVPGMILIFGLGVLATYTGYLIGSFKLHYPGVHNMADAGEILFKPLGMPRVGREVLGAAQIIFYIFVMGSHVLTFSIMMNTVTGHGTCSIVFGFVGLILCLICTLPRRLRAVSYMAIVSFISILASVIVTMAGVGIEKPGRGQVDVTMQTTLAEGFLAVTNIIFAYAGHVAFFSFISELKNPKEYPKALFLLQGVDTTIYLIVAGVVYGYAGADVASPALGSVSPLLQKVAYGVAIPTIIVAGVINGNVASKYIYVRMFRGTGMMSQKTFKSYGAWALIVLTLWTLAWIVAEAIPVFNDLLGLISSLFASWFTYGISGIFWLFINKGKYRKNKRNIVLFVFNWLVVLLGAVIMVLGLYATVEGIIADAAKGNGSFSCQDNSESK